MTRVRVMPAWQVLGLTIGLSVLTAALIVAVAGRLGTWVVVLFALPVVAAS